MPPEPLDTSEIFWQLFVGVVARAPKERLARLKLRVQFAFADGEAKRYRYLALEGKEPRHGEGLLSQADAWVDASTEDLSAYLERRSPTPGRLTVAGDADALTAFFGLLGEHAAPRDLLSIRRLS